MKTAVLASFVLCLSWFGASCTTAPAKGDPRHLVSVAEFARYDVAANTWENLPGLPEPRSLHGAAIVDSRLYAVEILVVDPNRRGL